MTEPGSDSSAGAGDLRGGVTVTGMGQASAVPDVFVAVFAAHASRSRPAEAMDAASAALSRMRDVALRHGASAGSLLTPRVSLRQDYDQHGRPHGFAADIALTVRSPQIARAGDLLTECIQAGGEQARLDSMQFEHDDPRALLAAAREAAFGDAQDRARQLAELAGRQLGVVISIEESAPGSTPVSMRDSAMFARASAVPVEPGSLDASVTLLVRWAWA